MRPSFAIIGCGKVGVILGKCLAGAGYRPVGFYSRRPASAIHAASLSAGPSGAEERVFYAPWEAARQAELVFIATPDQAIKEVCRSIAAHQGFREGAVVLHCSGALPSTVLSDARSCGANIGSMHPLQSFAGEYSGNPFHQIVMALEGEAPALAAAHAVAVDLSARPLIISTEGKVYYHAAAVVASNYLVTLMDLSSKLMAASGVPPSDAFAVLKPLLQGTLSNIEAIGIPDALTGPISRGDVETVETHLAAIRGLSPELAGRYARLGADTVPLALAKGTLREDVAAMLRTLLAQA